MLVTKLRSTTSPESQQYRKATKALLVLVPLLGVTYLLVLVAPTPTHVISFIQSILASTQVTPLAREVGQGFIAVPCEGWQSLFSGFVHISFP